MKMDNVVVGSATEGWKSNVAMEFFIAYKVYDFSVTIAEPKHWML